MSIYHNTTNHNTINHNTTNQNTAGKQLKLKHLILLTIALAAILGLTMIKDFFISGQTPNPVFYLIIPPASIILSSLLIFGFGKLLKRKETCIPILCCVTLNDIAGQIWENISKLTYHLIWEYPGILWLITFVLLIPLQGIIFRKLLGLPIKLSIVYTIIGFAASVAASLALRNIAGIYTTGS